MTLAEERTATSDPKDETTNMFPASATRVMPIIRMAQSSSELPARPSRSVKILGSSARNIALRPKTKAPVFRVSRRALAVSLLLITSDVIANDPLI